MHHNIILDSVIIQCFPNHHQQLIKKLANQYLIPGLPKKTQTTFNVQRKHQPGYISTPPRFSPKTPITTVFPMGFVSKTTTSFQAFTKESVVTWHTFIQAQPTVKDMAWLKNPPDNHGTSVVDVGWWLCLRQINKWSKLLKGNCILVGFIIYKSMMYLLAFIFWIPLWIQGVHWCPPIL